MCSDGAVPWTDLVLAAAALVATMNLLAVLVVARAHENSRIGARTSAEPRRGLIPRRTTR
jgi:hypothetical protein